MYYYLLQLTTINNTAKHRRTPITTQSHTLPAFSTTTAIFYNHKRVGWG